MKHDKAQPYIRKEDLSYQFIQKEPLTGSCGGMRFYLTREKDCLAAFVYPDRFCFAKTAPEDKIRKDFPNEPESMEPLTEWLNGQVEEMRKTQDPADGDRKR